MSWLDSVLRLILFDERGTDEHPCASMAKSTTGTAIMMRDI